jgi:hypothetical protein
VAKSKPRNMRVGGQVAKSKPRNMRVDLLGPSVGGLAPRWIYGTSTDAATARRQFAQAPDGARLVHLQITGGSPLETVIELKGDLKGTPGPKFKKSPAQLERELARAFGFRSPARRR